jgi:purine-binding chemotaxis protein CheW
MEALVIGVGRELFALEASSVREILDPVPTTLVPGAKHFAKWIINVRGNVIPLVSLTLRFGLPASSGTIDSRFVVLDTELGGDRQSIGFMADKVYEVETLATSPLGDTTKMGLRLPPELIRSVARWRDGIVLVPDIERILG